MVNLLNRFSHKGFSFALLAITTIALGGAVAIDSDYTIKLMLVVFLLLQFVIARSFFEQMVFLILFAPLQIYINFSEKIPLAIGYVFITIIFLRFILNAIMSSRTNLALPKLFFPFLLFIISLFPSLPRASLLGFAKGLLQVLFYLILLVLVYSIVRKKIWIWQLSKAFMVSGVIVSVLGIVQYVIIEVLEGDWLLNFMFREAAAFINGINAAERYVTGSGSLTTWLYRASASRIGSDSVFTSDSFRATALFNDPQTNSFFSALVFSSSLAVLIGFRLHRDKQARRLAWVTALLSGANSVVTLARTGWVAVIIVAVIAFLVAWRARLMSQKILLLLAVVGIAGAIGGIIVMPSSSIFKQTIVKSVSAYEPARVGRVKLMKQGIADTFNSTGNTILGAGFNNTNSVGPNYHSFYVNHLAETGIFGLLIYIWLLWDIFKEAWFVWTHSKDTQLRSVALVSGLVWSAYVFASIFHHVLTNPKIAISWWIVVGLIFAAGRLTREEIRNEKNSRNIIH